MARYQAGLTNPKTGEYILLTSNDQLTLQSKIQRKKSQWIKQNERLSLLETKEKSIENAEKLTQKAQDEIQQYNKILLATLDVDDKIDWEKIKDNKPFKKFVTEKEPNWDSYKSDIKRYGILETVPFFKKKATLSEQVAKEKYNKAINAYKQNTQKHKSEYEEEKSKYEKEQEEYNKLLDLLKENYEKNNSEYVAKYFDLVLGRSIYPDSLNITSSVYYEPNSKILLIDMDLPHIDQIPSTKEYKYNSIKKETTEINMGKIEFENFYNNVIYQIALRTVHEIIESDYSKNADLIVFNGWVEGIDTKIGKNFRNCILSLQVSRSEFLEINLNLINPRDCFRHLKGVSAGSLIQLAPVRPIMVMNEKDKRFIQADNISDTLGENTNLATMDWQEFEVLVRDLIQKEFSSEGCKVEVTRASRDAGVDAIAFDQDPIRGGKYIIQAKRYNNLVPVSAVRDLYGTVLNEGGVKGILITTSYYGKDAIEFANNKPLKLINGEELLYMFNKHGYKFRIDLTKKHKALSTYSY